MTKTTTQIGMSEISYISKTFSYTLKQKIQRPHIFPITFIKFQINILSECPGTCTTSNCDQDNFEKWINLVWLKHVDNINKPNLLIADSFSPHTSKDLKQKLENRKSFLSIIPFGCSSNIQPLHRGIKRSFKVQFY